MNKELNPTLEECQQAIRDMLDFLVYYCSSIELDGAAKIAARVGVEWVWPGNKR